MKILLVGDYSNVHWTLAEGLRQLGEDVTVVSDGDGWKNYHRDIDLRRRSLRHTDSIRYYIDCIRTFARFRDFDVVQLINPVFLDLRAKKMAPFYNWLRKHNRKIFLGAYGMDHYWVKTCMDGHTFRYSDFNIGEQLRDQEPQNIPFIRDWLDGEKTHINQLIADDCDGIITGLYEYDCCYRPYFPHKTRFIPFPIDMSKEHRVQPWEPGMPVRFFVGVQKNRSAYKGTDVMLRALERIKTEQPTRCDIVRVENIPYDEYLKLMDSCHVILDQLYSYTPAMNALIAMAKGLVVVGGGEEENYEILGETQLRPIINVLPDEEDVYRQLKKLVEHPEQLPELSRQSIEYVQRHHNHVKVAKEYLAFWQQMPLPRPSSQG